MRYQSVVERIKDNDSELLKKIYLENKLSFFKIANQYRLPEDVILDIYQDSMVALIENARKNKIDDLQSSVNTYLIGIGKFMIFNYLKANKKMRLENIGSENEVEYANFSIDNESLNKREAALKTAYEALGKECQQIINLFYFENKKLDEIQRILDYESKDVLKSQKSRCISHLKKTLNPKK
ncbi:RNA polymerase sigma factor [Xanthomarina gelatinilytica]|uniref:RNA polymerase sigma factor n=1 Tax=Xanthomarina gelatinilytica TaxID=1137281 RepID=UPI003AA933D4